jgi:cytochrome c-type biogenesis protein CcmH/NrfF
VSIAAVCRPDACAWRIGRPACPPRVAGTAQPKLGDPVARASVSASCPQELRCLVCQNQSIAESAGLAVDLRNQVREQVAAGKSDTEIIDFMTTRYGDFVLYSPPVKGTTLLLWYGPLLLLLTRRDRRVARRARAQGHPGPGTAQ